MDKTLPVTDERMLQLARRAAQGVGQYLTERRFRTLPLVVGAVGRRPLASFKWRNLRDERVQWPESDWSSLLYVFGLETALDRVVAGAVYMLTPIYDEGVDFDELGNESDFAAAWAAGGKRVELVGVAHNALAVRAEGELTYDEAGYLRPASFAPPYGVSEMVVSENWSWIQYFWLGYLEGIETMMAPCVDWCAPLAASRSRR